MPGVVFGAPVIVPSAFIVRLPLVGVGAVPGVKVTFALPLVTLAAVVPTVSFNSTLGVLPPATEPIVVGPSSSASITCATIGGAVDPAGSLGLVALPPKLTLVAVVSPPPAVPGDV